MIKIENLKKEFENKNKIEELVLGYSALGISLPIFIASKKNFFKKNNLKITLKRFDTAQPLINALVSGNIQAGGFTALPIAFNAMSESGKELMFITSLMETKESQISFLIKRKKSNVSKWKDIEGRRVGILPTVAYEKWVKEILKNNSVNIEKVDIVKVDVLDQEEFLKNGKIDFLFTNNPVVTTVLESEIGEVFDKKNELINIFDGEYIFGSFNIEKEFASRNKSIVFKLKKSLDSAIDYIEENPKESNKLMKDFLDKKNKKFFSKYNNLKYIKNNFNTIELYNKNIKKLNELGIIEREIDVRKNIFDFSKKDFNIINKKIFDNFNFNIDKKEIIGLFGFNGSGKSTLLNIIFGIDKEFSGDVKIETKNISYVYQKPQKILLPWFTAKENILLACDYKNISREEGEKRINKMSDDLKIDFSLYSHPYELSGGQQQVVAIVRALVVNPDILLMDEPFSALDVGKRENILELLKSYKDKTTMIITSHRGDEIASLLEKAIVFNNQPVEIKKIIYSENNNDFEKEVSEIRFN